MANRVFDLRERYDRRCAAYRSNTYVIPLDKPTPVLRYAPQGAADDRLPAPGRDPCPRCATRGDIGCAHQAPFVADAARKIRRDLGGIRPWGGV